MMIKVKHFTRLYVYLVTYVKNKALLFVILKSAPNFLIVILKCLLSLLLVSYWSFLRAECVPCIFICKKIMKCFLTN